MTDYYMGNKARNIFLLKFMGKQPQIMHRDSGQGDINMATAIHEVEIPNPKIEQLSQLIDECRRRIPSSSARSLLESINPFEPFEDGSTALHVICSFGNQELFTMFIDIYVENMETIEALRHGDTHHTPYETAVASNQMNFLEYIHYSHNVRLPKVFVDPVDKTVPLTDAVEDVTHQQTEQDSNHANSFHYYNVSEVNNTSVFSSQVIRSSRTSRFHDHLDVVTSQMSDVHLNTLMGGRPIDSSGQQSLKRSAEHEEDDLSDGDRSPSKRKLTDELRQEYIRLNVNAVTNLLGNVPMQQLVVQCIPDTQLTISEANHNDLLTAADIYQFAVDHCQPHQMRKFGEKLVRGLLAEYQDSVVGCPYVRLLVLKVISFLRERHLLALINTDNGLRDCFIHFATERGDISMVKLLCTKGPASHVDVVNSCGETALHIATTLNNVEIVKVLLHHGADVNVYSTAQTPQQPLCIATQWAINHNEKEIFDLLIATNRLTVSIRHKTPLHYACLGNQLEAVRLLLQTHRESLIAEDEHHETPLFLAFGSEEVVKALLEAGASVNHLNYLSQTPIFRTAEIGSIQLTMWLRIYKASVDVVDRFERTPKSIALERGHIALLNYLMQVSLIHTDMEAAAHPATEGVHLAIGPPAEDAVQPLPVPVDAAAPAFTVMEEQHLNDSENTDLAVSAQERDINTPVYMDDDDEWRYSDGQ